LSLGGGLVARGGDLWQVDRHLLRSISGGFDTVTLGRTLHTGPAVYLSAAYFQSRHLATTFEATLLALGTEARCTVVDSFITDPERVNEQACVSAHGVRYPTAAAALQLGLLVRPIRRPDAEPYFRAACGVAVLKDTFVETVGEAQYSACADPSGVCRRTLVSEAARKRMTLVLMLAVGATLDLSPGLRFRVEARDQMIAMPAVSSFATPTASPALPVDSRMRHLPMVFAGVDLVLERRPGRRP
jgi:hypothetical protein